MYESVRIKVMACVIFAIKFKRYEKRTKKQK